MLQAVVLQMKAPFSFRSLVLYDHLQQSSQQQPAKDLESKNRCPLDLSMYKLYDVYGLVMYNVQIQKISDALNKIFQQVYLFFLADVLHTICLKHTCIHTEKLIV